MTCSSSTVPEKENVAVGWSGGKDSALALHAIVESGQYDVAALVTTVTLDYDRISIHGVRSSLLRRQAAALGYDLIEVPIPTDCTNEEYETRTRMNFLDLQKRGVTAMVYGDIFLQDVRAYREKILAQTGLRGVFPLWGRSTTELANTFIELGFEAVLVCVRASALDESFAGEAYSTDLLVAFPADVDPCGENGEFHTFVYDGPLFSFPVAVERGETVFRDERAYYCDLVPA